MFWIKLLILWWIDLFSMTSVVYLVSCIIYNSVHLDISISFGSIWSNKWILYCCPNRSHCLFFVRENDPVWIVDVCNLFCRFLFAQKSQIMNLIERENICCHAYIIASFNVTLHLHLLFAVVHWCLLIIAIGNMD
jgi:hypothetical protein